MLAWRRLVSSRVFYSYPRFTSSTNHRPHLPSTRMSPGDNEGKVTATQADIDARQEELDAELKEVRL